MVDRIQVENLGKRYLLGERTNLRESVAGLARGKRRIRREMWSLRDVDFTVPDGGALGIVGRNGAGKSTILKILMRITAPTIGVSRTRGRIAALLEVGTGFHPELTGRENVFLNAAVLGMSRADTVRRFDEIVAFAGTERFLDTPVKRYSSGMYLRLAFAVAAHLEPDILIVDEVLAVGDAEFQRKCLGRMSEAEREGRTVVFVSHDLSSLTRLCSRALWLESGRVRDDGPSVKIVREYLNSGLTTSSWNGESSDQPVRLLDVRVTGTDGADGALMRDDPVRVRATIEVVEEIPGLDLSFFLTDGRGVRVLDEALSDRNDHRLTRGLHEICLDVPPVLNVGDHTLGVWVGTSLQTCIDEPVTISFTLHSSDQSRRDRAMVLNLPFSVSRTV